jgi:tetratricopeptide (TPR) repeat protein
VRSIKRLSISGRPKCPWESIFRLRSSIKAKLRLRSSTGQDARRWLALAADNQGRLALVARAQTTGLMRTPELTAEDNRTIETREFLLPELGKAKIIETTETFGTVDREYRGEFGGANEKALRDSLKSYVEKVYGEAGISRITVGDDTDLEKPMTLRIELQDARRGSSGRTEAAVGIFVSHIADRLPARFREEQKKDPEKPASPERTQDYVIAEPFTSEWRYRISAPAGFKIRQLPEAQDEKLAFTTLTARYARESDTTVTATFRFVMPKKRFTAAEGKALHEAVLELGRRKALLIYFDQVGETQLASGNVKNAIAEFDKLRKAHPNEALHFLQTARAMLAAGAGTSARAEARRAVTLEPNNAQAYIQFAEILKHDLVGRLMEKGFDRDGAAAAYRKALELDPADYETRAILAILVEHNASAIRYGEGARLDEAIDEYKKILDKLAGLQIPQNYAVALFRAGRAEELRDYLRQQPDSELNQVLKVCAEALLGGSKAAVSRAGDVSGVNAKQRVLASAGQTLLAVRQYELAADLFEAAAVGSPNPAMVANRRRLRFDCAPAWDRNGVRQAARKRNDARGSSRLGSLRDSIHARRKR